MTVAANLQLWIQLTRLNRPVGIYLLLWPTLWALWLASAGRPDPWILLIFIAGVVLMRSAGCVINDYADRDFDRHVQRTRDRPLTTGALSARQALAGCLLLCLIAFVLVCLTNAKTVLLSTVAVVLAGIYPFMKRHTHLPQFFLGAAFAWAVPMAFSASGAPMTVTVWLLFLATLLWTMAYDTLYAMVDREDDLAVGIKSSAILFGRYDRAVVALMQAAMLLCLFVVGQLSDLPGFWYAGLALAAGLFGWQHWLIRKREPARCFQAFLNNQHVGAVIFAGLFLSTLTH